MIVRVELEILEQNPFQTRIGVPVVDELAASVQKMAKLRPDTSGLIHVPVGRVVLNGEMVGCSDEQSFQVLLRAEPEVRVQLALGHRRWAAFQLLAARGSDEHGTLPVDVTVLDDEAMALIALEENDKRENISAIEKALAIQTVIDQFGWTQAKVGKKLELTQGAVSNLLRLLKLPDAVQKLILKGWLTERHGRALLQVSDVGLKASRLVRLAKHKPDVAPSGPDDFLSVAELELAIKAHVAGNTFKPTWGLDWVPDGEGKTMCQGCKSLVKFGRTWRCKNKRRFLVRQGLHLVQVKGPEQVRELHGQFQGWKRGEMTHNYQRCYGCERELSKIQDGGEWYTAQWRWVCPECWRRAGLPEIEAVEVQATEVARALPVAGVQASPLAGSATEFAKPSPVVTPPVPPPPPATVVTARILAGENLTDRTVMIGIAEEGKGPLGFRVGKVGEDYGEIAQLVVDACVLHFGGLGDISREMVGEGVLVVE